jgi:hypothetical protein
MQEDIMFQPGLELGRARQKALLKEVEIHEALKPLDKESRQLSLRDNLMLALGDFLIHRGHALHHRVKSRKHHALPQFSK